MKKFIVVLSVFVVMFSIGSNMNIRVAHACTYPSGYSYGGDWWRAYQSWCTCVGGRPDSANQSCIRGSTPGGSNYLDGAPQFLVFLFIMIMVFAIAFSAQKKKAALTKINLPPAQPPIMNNPAAPQAPAAGPVPPKDAGPHVNPQPKSAAVHGKGWKRIFRPVYGKKIWQKPKSQSNDKRLEKF